ncbi:ras-related protein Rab-39B isoform X3 [Apteryx mantelli]|uniref:Ras-related protein Rab-39B isoform X3 n=1 Tax=Apteryx mantelli TaxID=2696672 RepID=A0ABM4F608_9AVES
MEAIWLYQFRLIVIGDSTVGKSCLIRRFTEGRFAQISDPTVGVDFFSRLVEIEPGKRIKLQIWDTAGQERFRSITRAYYRNSVGGLLLFDITNRRSFQNVHEWLEETKVHVQPYQIVFVLARVLQPGGTHQKLCLALCVSLTSQVSYQPRPQGEMERRRKKKKLVKLNPGASAILKEEH